MTDLEGYDSVAMNATEWRAIVPEAATYDGVIGSYGNGRFANTTAAKQAFPNAKHVVYDINGSQPEDDLLDDEPGDANDGDASKWAHAHNATKGPHILRAPGLYKSASGVAGLISTMLDAGWKRTDFIIQSAHYVAGRGHVCGPDTCGFPQADATQHFDKGARGQNTDLNLWAAHCFTAPAVPAPDPDARYGLFDDVKRSLIQRATERGTVMQYDVWRAMQTKTKHPHRFGLAVRRARLRLLAGRLSRVMKGEKSPHPNQVWRLRELQDRAKGMRLV